MLTPEYLDTLPDTLVSLWQRVEDDILRDIARRIGKMDTVTETAAWQLWRLEQTRALRTDIVRLLAKYSGKSDTEIRRLLQEAGTRTLASDDALYQAMGLDPPNVNTSSALLNLLNAGYRQTRGTWQNFTRTTANTVTRQFENALDRAWLQVSSGAFDYKTAIKRAVDGLSQDMKYITYPTGHRDTLEVAVRRAVLTGVNQTACKLQIARADEMGCGFVEVSAHSGARSDGSHGPRDHAWWQGKVYHRGSTVEYNGERYESFEDATGYGTGEGLCGWNCRHNFHPFWPGISVPNYTPERLAELNARNIGYNGKMYTRYEINQQQRALERRVRAAKRKYLAESAAGVDATQAAVQLKHARQKLKAFVQATGGRADSARESVSGFGRSQASNASWAARKLGMGASALQAKDAMRTQLPALTEAERAQLTQYTGFDATAINSAIRHGRINAATQEKISILDSALAKGTIPNSITLYRETSLSFLEFDNGAQPDKNTIGNFIGQTIPNRIFTSTSFRQLGLPGRDTVIELHVPAGYQGALYIRDLAHPQYKLQDEVLFARGLKYRLLSVDTSGDKVYIKAEVIKP
ncbi:phage minor capsid protein [Ruthenibacterium lactatiformans]|uniref:phage minor capsid protein n=2 Tax=Ruthenibacterium lactatiformans TaxID=1550024 RepID=UPI000678C67D|nr:phage minor capsid protein [Ruthenibacterium lactatiformans]